MELPIRGIEADPAEAVRAPSLVVDPPAQRKPSPNGMEIALVPWKNNAVVVAGMFEAVSTSVSDPISANPDARKRPPIPSELLQPC